MSQEYEAHQSLASLRSRLKAFIIDDILITIISIVLLWDVISTSNGDLLAIVEIMNQNAWQLIGFKFLYHAFFIWYYGATVGKMYAKIRVVDSVSMGRVSLVGAIIRSIGRILSEMFFYIGFILAYYTPQRQTLQDKLAKTVVINVL